MLPSITRTYLQTLKLYAKCFAASLPFILLLMFGQFLIIEKLPAHNTMDWLFFIKIIADIALSAFFFSFMLTVAYQKHVEQKGSFAHVLVNGIKRSPQVFCAYLLLSLPILLSLSSIELGTRLWMPYVITPDVANKHLWITLGLIGVAFLMMLWLFVFSFAAGIFIVIKNDNALAGLKHSWKMMQPVWVDTLLLIIVFGIVYSSLTMLLDEYTIPYAYLIVTLLMSSLTPALMVIHFEQVAKLGIQATAAAALRC